MNLQYENLVTGRTTSLFAVDLQHHHEALLAALQGRRVAVIGAAGSIGSAVVKTLLRYQPGAITLIDLAENNLVELVRDLRSTPDLHIPEAFSTLPIGLGSRECTRYFHESPPYDLLFNLSAIKHVRSEKDIYCLMRMLDTNVLALNDLLEQVPQPFEKVFSVSSDKAANPANLMGASKMIMEQILWSHSGEQPFSTARFANVAFSDGSLPFGFLERINKRQPLAAPQDVRRFFISHREAGELCVLSAALGNNRDVFFPRLSSGEDEKRFSDLALDLLQELGYEPVLCDSEEEARQRCEELIPNKRWPCFFFASDTTGEKDFEEFYTGSEALDMARFDAVGVIQRGEFTEQALLNEFLAFADRAKEQKDLAKEDYVSAIQKVVPTLLHQETGKNLDQKM